MNAYERVEKTVQEKREEISRLRRVRDNIDRRIQEANDEIFRIYQTWISLK